MKPERTHKEGIKKGSTQSDAPSFLWMTAVWSITYVSKFTY